MSSELVDSALIDRLYDHFEDQIAARMTSQTTGRVLPLPKHTPQRANVLNVALYNPHALICWGRDLSASHLRVWQPYIMGSRHRFGVACVSNKGRGQSAMGLDTVPLYSIREGFDYRAYLPAAPDLSTLLYPANSLQNFSYMRHYPGYMHVHVGHGDSDKHSSGSRLAFGYDHIFVSGNAAMKRFHRNSVELSPERFLAIGGTVIPGVVPRRHVSPLQNILYAPTFEGKAEGVNFSSIRRAYKALKRFGVSQPDRLVCRGHPGTGLRDQSYLKLMKRLASIISTSPRPTKVEAFNWSDAIVTDISGVQSEYLFTGKPIILPLSPSDGWLYDYFHASELPSHVYAWDYRKIGLQAYLDKIAPDPLGSARLARRHALFLGAESFEDSLALFDDAMDHVRSGRMMRMRRQDPRHWQRLKTPPLERHPDDGIEAILSEIRAGRLVLRADDADIRATGDDAVSNSLDRDFDN